MLIIGERNYAINKISRHNRGGNSAQLSFNRSCGKTH